MARPSQTTQWKSEMTLEGYRTLLETLLGRGYQARRFAEAKAYRPDLVLRHDLDMSLGAALPLAEIERNAGVIATYFILVRTEMYNPFSLRGLAAVHELAEMGHDIGLHLDASLYDEDLDAGAEAECAALEAITGRPVTFMSFHRPTASLQGLSRKIAGRDHAYRPRYFHEMGYCSDSKGAWHHGHPLEHTAVEQGTALQLLTHPIWWNAGPSETVREKLDRFALRRFDLLRAELARNCQTYPQELRALEPNCD